jgi:hypothetical protein
MAEHAPFIAFSKHKINAGIQYINTIAFKQNISCKMRRSEIN